ncbi:MAG: hypothetical protein JWR69_63 [Pedosphaera sp.]|nr:hypothetical protein [Pedosphaera sp.]
MPADYYQDPDQDPGAGGGAAEPPEDQNPGEKAEGETALLPKSLLGGGDCQPGEKISLEVVHVYEDEVEVKMVNGEDGEKSPGTPVMDEAQNKLGMMGEE